MTNVLVVVKCEAHVCMHECRLGAECRLGMHVVRLVMCNTLSVLYFIMSKAMSDDAH